MIHIPSRVLVHYATVKLGHQKFVVSPNLSDNMPRKQLLRTILRKTRQEFKNKIKVLQQKQRKTMKCFAQLKDILALLKKNNFFHAKQNVLKDFRGGR